MIQEYRIELGIDEQGSLEEFTSDLFLAKEPAETEHLDDNGLVRPGTRVVPGMILAGIQGASKSYVKEDFARELEHLTSTTSSLIAKHGHMICDRSLRAPAGVYGVVRGAYFVDSPQSREAVIQIEVTPSEE